METSKRVENRRSKRYEVKGIRGNILYVHDIEVLNISIDGMAVETQKRLELNRTYTFKFYYKDSILNLRGKVVWAILVSKIDDKGLSVPFYRAGIRFLETYTNEAMDLARFIEENRKTTIEKRIGGVRFRIQKKDNIKIEYPEEYIVKKLSLSGMLVEASIPFKENSYHDIELEIDNESLKIKSRIAYCEKVLSKDVQRFDIGLEFIEMEEKERRLLADFVKQLENQNS